MIVTTLTKLRPRRIIDGRPLTDNLNIRACVTEAFYSSRRHPAVGQIHLRQTGQSCQVVEHPVVELWPG